MGLLDYITSTMAIGKPTEEEMRAALYAKRAATSATPTRGEATPQDLMRVMANMKSESPTGVGRLSEKEAATLQQMSPTGSGVGNLSELEALRLMEAQRKAAYGGNSLGNLSNQEALRMESLKNSLPYSLYRPYGAYASPQNTMQNILPELGGMSARNTTPMDLNMLLRMLGR